MKLSMINSKSPFKNSHTESQILNKKSKYSPEDYQY